MIKRAGDDPPESRPHHEAAGHGEHERWRNHGHREAVCRNGSDGEAVNEQRAGVIQQAFAFEDGQYPMRRVERAEHGCRGGGVRWGNYCAKGNRGGPRYAGQQRTNHHGNRCCRQSNCKDNQACKRSPVVFEISRRGVVRRIQQHGRDEERECEFGRNSQRGRPRNKSEDRTAER